jgi:hypothetical protein
MTFLWRLLCFGEKEAELGLQVPARPVTLQRYASVPLEADVSTELQNAAGISTGNLTECAAKISGAAIYVLELRVVEEVKRVDAKFERDTLSSKRSELCER